MTDESSGHSWGRALLWAALGLWCVLDSVVPLSIAIEKVNSGQAGSLGRLSLAMVSGIVGVAVIVLASRISPRVERYVLRGNILLLLLGALELAVKGLDQDELPHMHMSWQIGHGLLPFRDFFDIHHLFWNTLSAPLMLLMEGDLRVVVVAKLVVLVITLAALLGAAYLSRELGGWPEVTCLTGLTLFELVIPGTEFRADPAAALMLVAVLLLLRANRPAWAGVCAGAAILLIQKSLLPVGVMGVALLAFPSGEQGRWKPALRYGVAAGAVASLYFVWAAAHGILTEYAQCCYIYPAAFVKVFRPVSLFKSSFVVLMRNEILGHPAIVLGSLVGLGLALRKPCFPRLVGLVTVLCWTGAFVTALSFRQYLMFPNLLLVILTGVGAAHLRPRGRALAKSLPLMALCMCTYLSLLRWAADPPQPMNLDDASIALRQSGPADTYYGEEPQGHLGNPIFRNNALYYGNAPVFFGKLFRTAGFTPPAGDSSDPSLLVAHPPKVMIFSAPEREKAALELMRAAGITYAKEGNVLIRTP